MLLKFREVCIAGFLGQQSFLGFGILTVSFILLVVSVICNILINLHCKKLSREPFETDENDISRERIGMTETDNGYHTIIENNIRPENFEMGHSSEMTSTNMQLMDVSGIQFETSFGENEQQVEEDDYLHPYCTVMPNTVEVHEYQAVTSGLRELDSTNELSNQEVQGLYENIEI